MTTYNTGNPVGSADPKDLYDNAQNLDNIVNGSELSYEDRLGVPRRSLAGIDAAAEAVLSGLGYAPPVPYASGISLTLTTQTIEYNGEVYAPKSSALPFTTGGTFDPAKFRVIQGVLAADLAAPGGSALVGFQQSGTGAVARDSEEKQREHVSVLDFGADPTGSTDSTTAIQNAINTGRRVHIPNGTYLVSGSLTVYAQGQEIIGESMQSTVIKCTNAALATAVLRTDPAISRFWGLVLSDFKIEMPDGSSNDGININSPNWRCSVRRVWVRPTTMNGGTGAALRYRRANPTGDGVFDGYFTTTEENVLEGMGYGIVYDNVDGGMNCNWYTRNTINQNSIAGVYINGGANLVGYKNHLELNKFHALIEGGVGCIVEDNYMERSTEESVIISGGYLNNVESNYISAGYTAATAGKGVVKVDNSVYNKVLNNNFNEKFTDYHVQLTATAKGTSVRNNTCRRRDIYGGIAANASVAIQDGGVASDILNAFMDGLGNIVHRQVTALTFDKGVTLANSPIADAATLDYYQEGTFTPTVAGSTSVGAAAYSIQVGSYTRIGNRVQFNISLTWTGHTGTGTLRVADLPFTCKNTVGAHHPACTMAAGLTFTGQITSWVEAGQSRLNIYQFASAGTLSYVSIAAAGTLIISGSYEV